MKVLLSFFRAAVLTVAFTYVFALPAVGIVSAIGKAAGFGSDAEVPVILALMLIVLVSVWRAGLVRRSRGRRGMAGLSLSVLLLAAGLYVFNLADSGRFGVEIAYNLGMVAPYAQMAVFPLFAVSLIRLLFALPEGNGGTDRLPAAPWHKPTLILCLAMFFIQIGAAVFGTVIKLLIHSEETSLDTMLGVYVMYPLAMLAAAAVAAGKTRMNERLAGNRGFHTAAVGAALGILCLIMFMLALRVTATERLLFSLSGWLLDVGMIWIFLTLAPDGRGYGHEENGCGE